MDRCPISAASNTSTRRAVSTDGACTKNGNAAGAVAHADGPARDTSGSAKRAVAATTIRSARAGEVSGERHDEARNPTPEAARRHTHGMATPYGDG